MRFFLDNVRPYHYDPSMAHLHKKIKKGRPYYYIREMARVGGKPKVVKQIYLGSIDRLLQLAEGAKTRIKKLSVEEFGALWLANRIDSEIDLAALVDSVVGKAQRETGPSIGEYFLYAVLNRMVSPRSKRGLAEWYKNTAIQHIRPVNIEALTSQRYWDKWSKVTRKHLDEIAALFFAKVSRLAGGATHCFLFDTTNYYTYMASHTESDLAKRGKNKDGKNWLRQIGVALLVSRDHQLPLYFHIYRGNQHDSRLFQSVLDKILSTMTHIGLRQRHVTLVFDKGMNSEDNIRAIDNADRLHFITSYSSYFAPHLIRIKLDRFKAVDTKKNRLLAQQGKGDDQIVAWRTKESFWNKERTVIVTYNPRTAAKQRYQFDRKLLKVQQLLIKLRSKVATQKHYWTQQKRIEKHHDKLCDALHLPKDLYEFAVEKVNGRWKLVFRKNHYRINRYLERFGKNIIVTDHHDWSTDEIVRASLDRYMIEKTFRDSKGDDVIRVVPIRHWTDDKIRCHVFTCVVALTYLRLIELRLRQAGLDLTAQAALGEMRNLHSCLCWANGSRKPQRFIEDPTEIQTKIIKAFGYQVSGGVLQKLPR